MGEIAGIQDRSHGVGMHVKLLVTPRRWSTELNDNRPPYQLPVGIEISGTVTEMALLSVGYRRVG